MSKKFYETDEFKKLNKEWSKKLKADGFHDAEFQSDQANNTITKQVFNPNVAHIAHMNACRDFLNSGKLTDPLDIAVFELYCEGKTSEEIATILPTIKVGWKRNSRKIRERIQKILSHSRIPSVLFS